MRFLRSSSFWIKSTQALLLAIAVCFSLGASNTSARYNDLNHRLMCGCGCNQLLGECNHVGCPASPAMLQELSKYLQAGLSDQAILTKFANEYGMTVLAAPPKSGFNLVAWIAPFAVLAAGLLGTILLVRRWSIGASGDAAAAAAEAKATPELDPLRERIRRETGAEGDN
ncbi:MAG: cytochrome c-type biogenesis protein CcmH [Acidobacteriota bacterium]|nr:cytochrome c-type biogenesis protein CcmH [Acidobacteriota bacterium]